GLSPSRVRGLCEAGHKVWVEAEAGVGAGFTDDEYQQAGATIVSTAAAAWDRDLVVKVKEPLKPEYQFLQKGQL
ncbi:MAG TPA: alanine dehydrogenase, partial [Cyanobacteria bacterium UBA12227]|nr:alanine dehydrogenase [Cyanobacteria bacterium UBA12227]